MIRGFLVIALLALSNGLSAQCDWETMKNESQEKLKPFKYYAFKVSKIIAEDEPVLKELQIPLFHDAEYRFIFHKGGLPDNVEIEIWNAPANFPGRKMIWKGESGQDIVIWDPPETHVNNRIFINYLVPTIEDGGATSGCIVFYSGFKH
jgi:hypothetical protein